MKSSPIFLKQKLSPKAAAAKKKRDIATAKTTKRKARKAENHRIGQSSTSALHHSGGKVKRTSYNLPDYNLPEVEPIKKTKKRVKRRSSTGGY